MKSIKSISKFAALSMTSAFIFQVNSGNTPAPKSKTPNIILIYLDDMGYGDLSITGACGYGTPNINRMASEGMFFTHFYSPQAVSSASRAGVLTGCYPNRIGITGALNPTSVIGINEKEQTIAEMLKQIGYKTAAFGKWHLGHHKEFLPVNHGFDEFYGIPYSNDMWPRRSQRPESYPELVVYENMNVVNPAVSPDDQTQFTTVFTEKTIQFIKRNKKEPFFIYLAHPMPHVPLYVSDKFRGKSSQGLFGDVMMEIDWSIGMIINTVKKYGLMNNTLIILTSDNGPWLNYGNHAGSTGGLREGKGTTFEGGQRVPCLMMWKGYIPAGTVCNNMASAIDILPTLSAITGAPLSDNKIDGVNILPLMQGNFNINPREVFYYYYRQNSLEAVRFNNWKLVFAHPGRSYEGFQPGNNGEPGQVNNKFNFHKGLYDLRRDPGERYNLIDYYPDKVTMLEKLADEAREDMGDDLQGKPGKNRRPPGRVVMP